MPELPEVETIARQLRQGGPQHPPLPGRRIDTVTVRWPRHIATHPADRFRKAISGRTIRDVDRRGKYLVFPLDQGTLLIHLKMTGDLGLRRAGEPAGPYDHTIFHLDQGWDLRFGDARKFGKVFLLEDPGVVLTALGPEPLVPGFTARRLHLLLQRRNRRAQTPVARPDLPRRSGEHLRRRSPPPRRPASAAAQQPPERGTVTAAVAVYPSRPAFRPALQRRQPGLGLPGRRVSESLPGVRTSGRTLPEMRDRHPPDRRGPARHPLLPDVPTASGSLA